jgi:SAM-dependent methyltransferase
MSNPLPGPTDPRQQIDRELDRWTQAYAGDEYYYGDEPGPIARRTFRYHRPYFRPGQSTALDAGCGEGQDVAYLASLGYQATGVEFTAPGAEKARRLLSARGFLGDIVHQDLRAFLGISPNAQHPTPNSYDVVIAVNTVQFLGEDAPAVLDALMERVAPGGVMGVSLFGREPHEPEVSGTIWFTPLAELLERFKGWQYQEAANLWQWDSRGNRAQPFVQLIARKVPPSGMVSLG